MHARLLPLLLPVLAGTAALRAQELSAYEPFDYATAGQTVRLDGANGGFGWATPWRGTANPFTRLGSWWPFDGAAGDVGPLASHGTPNRVTYTTGNANLSWSSGALSLDGTAHVDLSAHVAKYATLMRGTIAAWVRTSNKVGSMAIFSMQQAGILNQYATFYIKDGRPAWEVAGTLRTNGLPLVASSGVADGTWHHVAIVGDGFGDARVYVDGQQRDVGPEGFLGYLYNPDSLTIGRRVDLSGPQWPFIGEIDDLGVWGDALTPTDLLSLAQTPPLGVNGPGTPLGPDVDPAGLGSVSIPSGALGSRGLSQAGGRHVDSAGNRCARLLNNPVDMDIDATYYLSFMVRRDDKGGPTAAGEMQFGTTGILGLRLGWTALGKFGAGTNQFTPSLVTMLDNTPYFVVVKVFAQTLASGNADRIQVKCYAPGELVHTSENLLSGAGTGANQWTIDLASGSSSVNSSMVLTLFPGGVSTAEFDEIRIGRSWDAVSRLGYGAGCENLAIRRTNHPRLGIPNFGINLIGALPNKPAFLHIGVSKTNWQGLNLPLSLASLGAGGCSLLQSMDLTVPTATDATGKAVISLAVPNNSFWLTAVLFAQWSAADPSNPPLGLATSDGMEILFSQ